MATKKKAPKKAAAKKPKKPSFQKQVMAKLDIIISMLNEAAQESGAVMFEDAETPKDEPFVGGHGG